MKRLFLLIPVLVFSLLANATVINITPTSPESSDNLRRALASAADGDIIEMAAGTYVESPSNYIAFDGKHVTVRAAEGADVLIQPQVPITIANGGCAHFENVKIDASHLMDVNNWYSHSIYPTDASENNRIILDGCEMYGFNLVNSAINCGSSYKLDAVSFNNCYFHDMMKSVLFIESTAGTAVQIANSTFANIETSSSYSAGVIDTRATSGSFSVDHCTFYNCQVINTDYGTIGKVATPGAVVSNCIFAMPESTADLRAIRDVATANNCLTYNYTKDSNWGIHSSVTKNNCIQLKDPLFTDAANGDFSFANNWVTMSISPACGAATDGSDLGDPRWYSDPVVPSSNFASPYQFVGAKAQISGNIWYDGTNEYLYYNDKSENGVATWKINATRSCIVEVTLNVNVATDNGHTLKVEVLDAEGNSIGETAEPSQTSASGDIVLPDQITLPAAGIYTVKLYNLTSWSTAKIDGVTFAYAGGASVDLSKSTPASLLANADAIVSDDWSIEDGKITHDESKALTGWAKWNVNCADYGNYNVTVNISSDNGHLLRVEIFENESESAIYTLDETEATRYHTGNQAIDLGNIVLDNRKYVVKISNTQPYSHVQIASIVITYLNGARATLPATCTFADLILSTKAHVTDGNLWFNTIGDSNPVGQWAKWNIKAASAGTFLFTMNVSSTNGQSYKISILDMEENELDAFESGSIGSGDKTIKHYFNLAAGNYIVKLENTYSWSQGHIASLVVTQPSLITIDEAATSNSVITGHYRDGNHDIKIIRTITSGMQNTICLPFDVSSSQLKAIFGSDVELIYMSSASISDDVLVLYFEPATSIYRGTPYLIKTTKTVSNPVFTDVEIKEETGQSTVCDNADFIGTFIKRTITANEDNLFLGSGNKLQFSDNDVTIKGMRAYFKVKNSSGTPIRHARIVEQSEVVTELELINGEWQDIKAANGTIKTIENGQLILIRDGKRYNVMGIRF